MKYRIVAIVLIASLLAGCSSSGGGGSAASTPAPIAPSVVAEAARIGSDTGALLARVADGIAYETYPGVFRGAEVTLADGTGNTYDKALLLHDLVLSASPSTPIRFASCTLSSAQTDAVLAAERAAYRAPSIAARGAAAAAAKATNANTKAILQHLATLWSGTVAQARDESALLAHDLHAAGASPSAHLPDARPIAADHVWIQVQQNGAWLDLDPTLPKAKPGAALCSAASTADALPDDAYDTVTATLRYETRIGSKLGDATVATIATRASDAATRSLTFMFALPADKGPLVFTPQLRFGSEVTAAPAILVPPPPADAAPGSSSTKKAKGGADFFASPVVESATPEPTATAAQTEPVALWLEVVVATRGQKPLQVERPIFDRVSYAVRAAGHADTATLAEWNDNAYAPFATAWNIGASLGSAVVGTGERAKAAPKSDLPATIRALGGMQRGYYAIRRAVFADERGATTLPIRNVVPGVSFAGIAPRMFNGLAAPVLTMDIASDAALPDGGDASALAAWGVASLVAERTVTNADALFAAAQRDMAPALVPAMDVIAVFDVARKNGVASKVVASASDVDALGASSDAKARLGSVLTGGGSALAPVAPVPLPAGDDYGWWILAPDGSVRDQMQDGMHDTGAEEAALTPSETSESVKTGHAVNQASRGARCALVVLGLLAGLFGDPSATGSADALIGAAEDWETAEEFYSAAGESTGELGCAAGASPPLP